ncbi:MAG: hypothetical protein M1837_003170 [Sclerophora amabilis]|nr:MAG: hypothetical protein M1837_003170 [Sclerophora amabilis]
MGQLGDLSPGGSVAVGVIVGLISTSVQSLGLTLQRKSHILEDEKAPHDPRRPPHRRRRWQLGMLMFVVSNLLGSTIQITTLPLPVLSTLQASGLVFNSICATLILGEPFTRWSFGGTVLVCGGAILIAMFGAIAEPAHNLDQLLLLLGRRTFVVWMVGQALLVALVIAGAKSIKILRPRTSNTPRLRLLRGIAYGSISGILSAHSLLVAKTAVELLVRTIVDRVNQFNRWQSWVTLLGLLALALSQLYYLHRGLKLCSTSVLYPLVFCIYNIIAILDGLIYFRQASRLSLLHGLLIALGTVILLSGVLALSWRLNAQHADQPSQAHPQVAQSALAPGLGLVDDTTSTEDSNGSESDSDLQSPLINNDEEATLSFKPRRLFSKNEETAPLTPTSKDDNVLRATRIRRKGMTEADEIWGELEDEDPHSHYGTAVPASPSVQYQHRRESSGAALSSLAVRRNANFDQAVTTGETDDGEDTPLLHRSLGTPRRSATVHGSNGRQQGRRRSTHLTRTPSGLRGRSSPRAPKGSDKSMQEALGGWWKMKWWKRNPPTGDNDEEDQGGGGGSGGR